MLLAEICYKIERSLFLLKQHHYIIQDVTKINQLFVKLVDGRTITIDVHEVNR